MNLRDELSHNVQATTDRSQVADPASGAGPGWLLLVYRVPVEPTRLRSAVWRHIKSFGAIYLQNSVAALPASTANERALRKLRHEIMDMSGRATLMSCSVLAGGPEVRAMFQEARNDEYEKITEKCEDFLRQVQKEYNEDHFTYAQLQENEADLVKLRKRLAKAVDRDVFTASGREVCEQSLEKCERWLEAYAAWVYAEEAEG
jgi:vacuolar-type H+-ATPase subunit I/STV1